MELGRHVDAKLRARARVLGARTINNTERVFVLTEIKRMSYVESTAAVVVLTQQDGVFVAHELLTMSLTASYTHVGPNVRPLKCSRSHSCNFLRLKTSAEVLSQVSVCHRALRNATRLTPC